MKQLMLIFLLPAFVVFAQEELEPWERLGLSKTEWKLIVDSNMPMSQVENLLKAGIGISEYFDKPWEELGLTEAKWIEKRRSGMSNYDIKTESEASGSEWKSDMKSSFRSEMGNLSENAEDFSALLPGFYQLKTGSIPKGVTMASLAVGSVTWCTAGSISRKQFYSLPLIILVSDVAWSYIDYKISKRHKKR